MVLYMECLRIFFGCVEADVMLYIEGIHINAAIFIYGFPLKLHRFVNL
jgi:hypothetical protein